MNQTKTNYFILTGAMGAGKSTILKQLRALGVRAIDEPARQILAEQRSIGSEGVPDRDQKLFNELLLSRSIAQFQKMQDYQRPVIFDRGIPGNIGYASLFGLSIQAAKVAADKYRYNNLVFFAPGWEAIYENDDERKMSFEQANEFGNNIKTIYEALGYNVVDVPFDPPLARANFILEAVEDNMPPD
ncbi:MAG: AAA family ATPase [Gammaproteobacteria bacterium]